MRKILIGTHGYMASGIKSSINILLGASDNITAIDAYVDESSIKTHMDDFFSSVNAEDYVIMLSDIYGGSVNQEMFKYLNRPNTYLITGINLALVIEIAIAQDLPISETELIDLVDQCKESMTFVKYDGLPASEPEDFF